MSIRANIKFTDGRETYYVDSSHDGFPGNVIPDIELVINRCIGKWSGSELGLFVSCFLGVHFDPDQRIQTYAMCTGLSGDESYAYYVEWNDKFKKYEFGEI